jgi:hypothetical protein
MFLNFSILIKIGNYSYLKCIIVVNCFMIIIIFMNLVHLIPIIICYFNPLLWIINLVYFM